MVVDLAMTDRLAVRQVLPVEQQPLLLQVVVAVVKTVAMVVQAVAP